jgi:hypothetical protein
MSLMKKNEIWHQYSCFRQGSQPWVCAIVCAAFSIFSFERSHHHCLSFSSTASIALALLLLVLLLVLACMLGHNI